ncbi:hypothetical protein H0N99_02180 [Candidatus Micrarchaeota archaeon]|nr:hypothetical protein [Candidatus Micrarchaeota archaeon]
MVHLQKSIEEHYGKDVAGLFEDIKNAHTERQISEVWNEFIKKNWRDKEFHSKIGSITDLISREASVPTLNYAVPELARILSKLNVDLRNDIREGRNKPGMEKMTADGFEEKSIKDGKGQPKDGEEFAKEKLLNKEGNASRRIEVNDALLDLRHGGLTPDNTAAVMRNLAYNYIVAGNTGVAKDEAIRLEELMRTINFSLASEYRELRGKLESQKSFRNANLR